MRPRSPYGVAKLAAFGLVDTLRRKHGLHASSAIAYNHESPRRPERFLPRKVCRAAASIRLGLQDEVALGDLGAVRDWCHARDVVRGYRLMLAQDEPGDYVLAGGVGRTVGELVDAAFGCVGLDPPSTSASTRAFVRPAGAHAARRRHSRARERLGWEPETSFRGDDRGDGAGRPRRARRPRAAPRRLAALWPSESSAWATSACRSPSPSPQQGRDVVALDVDRAQDRRR